MTNLYDICYDWFYNTLLAGNSLTSFSSTILGQSIDLKTWLAHTGSITIMVLISIFLIMATIWLFKFIGGLFKW